MNFSIRVRVSVAAGVVVAAGLAGCQTCRDCVDRIPRPELPTLRSIVPFGKPASSTHAEHYQRPLPEAVRVEPAPPILPLPSTTNVPSRTKSRISRPASNPPPLPPFDPETPVPSAGLFPAGPVRRMGFETSSVIQDSNIIQTGWCAPMVSSCGPPPCCPTPCCETSCCETSCCPTGCELTSRIAGTVALPFYMAKAGILNAKDRLRCKLSSIGSCCNPCVLSCNPCGSGVINEYVMEGVVVNQYPMNGGCSPCSSGMTSIPQIPMHQQMAPRQQWQQPGQNFGQQQPPCGCQNQQAARPYSPQPQHPPQPQYAPQQPYQSRQQYAPQQQYQSHPQYRGAQPVYSQPQVAARQPVPAQQYRPAYRPAAPQQPVAQPYQYQPQPAQQPQAGNQNRPAPLTPAPQTYTAPQPVQPAAPQTPPTSDDATPEPAASQTSSLSPGHSPLAGQSPTRTATIFRSTRYR